MLRNEIFKCAQVLVLCSVLKGTVQRWPDWLFLFSPFPSGVWSSWVPVTQHWCCRWFLNCSAHTRTLTHQSLTWTIRPVSFTYLKIFFFLNTYVHADMPHQPHSAVAELKVKVFTLAAQFISFISHCDLDVQPTALELFFFS